MSIIHCSPTDPLDRLALEPHVQDWIVARMPMALLELALPSESPDQRAARRQACEDIRAELLHEYAAEYVSGAGDDLAGVA
ncbi:hypothetical protein [Spongiactinospora sp. 9N601]|uniref:hypothetical protein n=1 Tax=Spongiactinospora sp. 9N601 TaxID=3375149 RepID=UPI0037B13A51